VEPTVKPLGWESATPDPEVTLVPIDAGERVTLPAPEHVQLPPDPYDSHHLATPLLPAPLSCEGSGRATLTVLTGLQAGRLLAVDAAEVIIGRTADADLVVDETGVSRRHARIARNPEGGFYVEDLASTNGTFIGAARVGVALLHQVDVLQLGPHLRVRFAIVDPVEESLGRHLYESATHDPLTHVFNRKYLADLMLAEVSRARRANTDLVILMLDVDSLKGVNDRFGHLAGDRALCTFAAGVRHALRIEDVLARYGGDEFVVLATGTGLAEAMLLGERIRHAVEQLHMCARGRAVRITTSIGAAALSEVAAADEPLAALLSIADARMYGAKASGGNRVGPPETFGVEDGSDRAS
jgi:two-component system cell cycle response regulator